MPRINPVTRNSTDAQTLEVLADVEKKIGMIPNLFATMANSPAALKAYLGFSQALGEGRLSPRIREQISLVVGEVNSCNYCVSAHTALGKGAGLQDECIINARMGRASDSKEQAVLSFAKKIVHLQGKVENTELDRLRSAGFEEGEICEIVANVALNIFTNYFNHVAATEVDFPVAPEIASTVDLAT